MRIHALKAQPLGVARLDDHRFVVMHSGYASVVPDRGASVFGVLWRLTARDVAALNAYESLASGLYRAARRSVLFETGRKAALVYIGNGRPGGRPRPGYMDVVLNAAQAWSLPETYVRGMQRLGPMRSGARAPDVGEMRWSRSDV